MIHRTYTFDSALFYKELSHVIDYDGCLHIEKLEQLARVIATTDSETIQQALEAIRFDDEWFDTSDNDISHTTEWYMIYLASKLNPAPSLSNRSQVSWHTLNLVLPYFGWHETEIETLCRGNLLNTLVEESNNQRFIAEFTCINQFGGWLNPIIIKSLSERLLESKNALTHSNSKMIEAVNNLATLLDQKPIEIIQQAFSDATEMLQTANKRKESLFIILD